MKLTQKKRILNQLRNTGSVTRNWALSQFISRLGAIILELKKEGMHIEGAHKGTDYIYTLKDKPKDVITYLVEGVEVGRKVIW